MGGSSPVDPSSFSKIDLAIIKHISLSLSVNFEKKVIYGLAVLNIEVLEDISDVILDVKDLTIEQIDLEDGTELQYTIGDHLPDFGSKLTITLPKKSISGESPDEILKTKLIQSNEIMYKPVSKKEMDAMKSMNSIASCNCCCSCTRFIGTGLKIRIKYVTSPTASALQWLDPAQTSGKNHPYLFSQCQPIHARSILPCQDSPAVKFTYDAEVTAPAEFTVLMSAIRGDTTNNRTMFHQPVPIPSYLLAIAVGVLEHKTLGPRSHVWAEKNEIERSAWEFAETENYLQAAERLCGKYQWTQYDLLVLPPSFPYGGMENPCLTFVTPTLLAGDRSQADVIVHEIMHSWTGNLVTNRNFEHFWLNEGFTVFLERKVAASLIADSEEAKKSRDFHSILGMQELKEAVNEELGQTNPLTRLVVNLTHVHPDVAFSTVPYEKGEVFLRYLEKLVGGSAVFNDFILAYLTHFQKKSLDTDQFKAFFIDYFKDNENIKNVDWNTWLYSAGMPPIIPDYDTSMTKEVTALVAAISENAPISHSDVKLFTPHQIINLLQELIERPALSIEKLNTLGEEYKVSSSKNTEIQYRWIRLCLRSHDLSKLNEVFDFVNKQGRMKYVRPIYRDLYAWEEVRQQAIDNFLSNEKYMMHVSAYTLRKDLHLSE